MFPELELCVTVYNINWGNNQALMDACRTLREYAQYVEQVRIYARELAYNNGLVDGKQLGLEQSIEKGEQRLIKLQQLLLNLGKNDDLIRAINDKDYREQLYKEYNL